MAWTEKYANFDLTTGDNDGSSEANAWQTTSAMTTGLGATVSVPTRVNIKRQSVGYNLTSGETWSPAGTAICPLWYRGYATTPGDGGLWQMNASGSGTVQFYVAGENTIIDRFQFNTTKTGQHTFTAASISEMRSCMIEQSISSLVRVSACTTNCDIYLYNGAEINFGDGASKNCAVVCCRIVKGDSVPAYLGRLVRVDSYGRSVFFVNNHILGSGDDCCLIDRAVDGKGVFAVGNTFFNGASGVVVDEEPDDRREWCFITNNVFDTMSAYAVKGLGTEAGFINISNNYYRACTSGLTNYTEASTLTNTALTASPFIDAANGDFRLNETAGGGAVLRAAGFPVNYPYDWDNMADQAVYEGPLPADIAAAVWARTGRTLTL